MNIRTTLSAAVLFSLLVSSAATAQGLKAPEKASHTLRMVLEHDRLLVQGGSPFNACALILGVEETSYTLPGNAELSVAPLLVLLLGNFDAGGEYALNLKDWTDRSGDGAVFFAQAISTQQDSEFFATSNVLQLGQLGMIAPDQDDDDGISDDGISHGGRVDPKPIDDSVKPADTDDGGVDTNLIDNGVKPVDTDDGRVDPKPIDDGADTKPTHGNASSTSSRTGTAPLDNSVKPAPIG